MGDEPLNLTKDEIRQRLEAAFRREENRLGLRSHALYCASMVYNGWLSQRGQTWGVGRAGSQAITSLAEDFVGWLTEQDEAEPGPVPKGGE